MIIIDGVKYNLWTPKDEEKEFHPIVKEHFKEIFGENSLYFDVRHILKSASGIGSIPDAYVISLSKPFEWYVVENELSSHSVYDHIVNQLTRFINGIKNQDARNRILDMLYDEINKDGILKATVKKHIDTDDMYLFLSRLLSTPPRIVVIIDHKTHETEEACQSLNIKDIVEFKTYTRENAQNIRAHFFEPLNLTKEPPTQQPPQKKPPRKWDEKLVLADENVREATKALTSRIEQLDNVSHRPTGPDYIFFRETSGRKLGFVGLFLTRPALKVRIRTDPATFRDPKKWTGDKEYHWFFKVGEKEFKITSKEQLDYAMELIKQSHQLASEKTKADMLSTR
jgi:predicted transport protein